ncbi:tyrosine-type recombinase/integrase [Enterococcus sp. AZ103]|uniref:site-specific integrase n=1 Tax=Enterococcus sp. AZ103 TaxID=2774628 RepID=UPI003F27220A
MAMIKQYQKKNGDKAWYFKTYLGINPATGKKQYTTKRGFRTQKEAKIALARLELQAKDNKYTPQSNVTYGEVAVMWLKRYKNTVKESSYNRVYAIFQSNILPLFKEKRISQITIPYCQNAVNQWYKEYKSYKAIRSYASDVFEYAKDLRYIHDNPMTHVPVPKKKKEVTGEKKFFEKNELERFLKCCSQDSYPLTYPIFRLLSFSGMRKGELLALTWNDIDFENKNIKITKTVSRDYQGRPIITDPKNHSSNRQISLDQETINVLKKWRKNQREYLLSYGFNSLKPDQLVFSSKSNLILDHARINRLLRRICKTNNIEEIKVHGLRHTHCSLLFEAGLSIQEVQYRLGHSNPRTTLGIYSHVTKKQKENSADKFAEYINF